MRPIFCGNFDYDTRQSDLERLFRKFGRVERVDIKSGFAFIYMEDERDAEDAIRALDRSEFGQKGRRLRVEWTKQERGIRRPEGGGGSRRSATNTRPSKTLFVINFDPYHTRTRDLERHFESYGKIVNVRIRRNFAFVQYDSLDDATRALEATNLSKLMDRVISVEYAVRDDDDRGNGYSSQNRGRSPEKGHDRRRSPSPYRRERGSPDYGRGSSRSPYKKERGSPDYGRGRSPSLHKRDRGSPEYGQITSRSPHRRERAGSDHARGRSPSLHKRDREDSPEYGQITSCSPPRRERAGSDHARGSSRSPYRKERSSPENIRGRSRSPPRRERAGSDHARGSSRSPYRKERSSPENIRDRSPYRREKRSAENDPSPSHSPHRKERPASNNGRRPNHSPYGRERTIPQNGRGPSPSSMPERRASPYGDEAESPVNEGYCSKSPAAEE